MRTSAGGRRVLRSRAAPPARPGPRARPEPPARRRRRLRRSVVFAGIVVVLVGAASWAVFGTSLLGVREIVVTGAQIAGDDQVRAAAAVAVGTPLLRVDTGAVAARVRSLPSVADVVVSRSFPHTLRIAVTERTPAAVVPEQAGYAVVAADGTVFHHVPSPPPGVVVIRVPAPGAGDPATLAALRVAAALTPQLRALLAEVVAPTPTSIRLELGDGRVVVWGDAEKSEAKASVATALLDRAAHTIDVTVPEVASVS